MSGRDFFTLQRRIFAPGSWLWDMPANQTKVAVTLIGMANWKEGKTFSGGEVVIVARGQIMTSLDAIAKASRVSKATVRTTLHNLIKAEFLTCKSTNRFRIITILNYSREQSRELSEQHANQQAGDRPSTGRAQAGDTPSTPIEPSNQLTKEPGNQDPPAFSGGKAPPSDESFEIADSLRDHVLIENPSAQCSKRYDRTKWARKIDSVLEPEGRYTAEQLRYAIGWLSGEQFGAGSEARFVVESATGFAKKIDNIAANIRSQAKRGVGSERTSAADVRLAAQLAIEAEEDRLAGEESE